MQTLQTILCRAAVDGAFLNALIDAPRRAVQQYDLSPAELGVLTGSSARSLADLAAAVEAWRRGEPATTTVRRLAVVV
jgi:phytoene/squalene synthetase